MGKILYPSVFAFEIPETIWFHEAIRFALLIRLMLGLRMRNGLFFYFDSIWNKSVFITHSSVKVATQAALFNYAANALVCDVNFSGCWGNCRAGQIGEDVWTFSIFSHFQGF